MAIVAKPSDSKRPSGHAGIIRLFELLREEQAALDSGNTTALQALVAAKERALSEIRNFVTTDGTANVDRRLAQALREAAHLNMANGHKVSARLTYIRSRHAGLMQAARAVTGEPALYRADGLSRPRGPHAASFGRA